MAVSYMKSIPSRLVLGSFSGAISGVLTVDTVDGKTVTLGQTPPLGPGPRITVHSDWFWARVLLLGDVGFAQSYMLHEISSDDLTAVLEFFIGDSSETNKPAAAGLWPWTFGRWFRAVLSRGNGISAAASNAQAHYSQSNEMFSSFLSPDMTYSAPLWLPKSDPRSRFETLEDAQLRKLEYALRQTRVQDSDHVLEIGTGWGSFAILAARRTGCRVTTVTLSDAQKFLAEERIRDTGVGDRVEVLKAEYRELDGMGSVDKIVSIEMIEHVGHEFLATFFKCMDRYLKKTEGIAYFQCITIPETRYQRYLQGEDFIKKYIFPGAHYPRALRSWRESFLANSELRIVPAMRMAQPDMTVAEMDEFKRRWEEQTP